MKNNKPVIMIGNGGHAKVLTEILIKKERHILGFTSPIKEENFFGLSYLGTDDEICKFSFDDVNLVLGIGSVSIPNSRKILFLEFKSKGFTFENIMHDSAILSPSVVLGEGVQIMAGSVIQTLVNIADNTIVNTGSIIDHDCVIGSHCHIAPGVRLSGNVIVNDECHLGIASTVIQGISIGTNVLVGAGAVVINNIPSFKRVVGIPAKEV